VWEWFNSRTVFIPASAQEAQTAVAYARSQIGKPFNWGFLNKFNTEAYYCSSLVWRAWYSVNPKYDLDQGVLDTWVAPWDVIGAADCQSLVDGLN